MYRFKRRASFVAQVKGIKGIGKSEFGMTTLWWGRNFHEWAGIPAEIHVAYHTSDALAQFKDCHQRGVVCLLLQDERNRTSGHGSRAYVGRLINFLEQTRKAGHWYVLATPQLWEELVGVMDCYFEVQRIDDDLSSPTYRHSELMIYTMDKGPACLLHLPIHPDEELRAKYEKEKDTHVDTVIEEEGLMEEVDFEQMKQWADQIIKNWQGQFDLTCAELEFRFPTLGITNIVRNMVKYLRETGSKTFDDEPVDYQLGELTGDKLLRTMVRQEFEHILRHAGKRKWKRDADYIVLYVVPPFVPFPQVALKDQYSTDHPIHKISQQRIRQTINYTLEKFSDKRKGKIGEHG